MGLFSRFSSRLASAFSYSRPSFTASNRYSPYYTNYSPTIPTTNTTPATTPVYDILTYGDVTNYFNTGREIDKTLDSATQNIIDTLSNVTGRTITYNSTSTTLDDDVYKKQTTLHDPFGFWSDDRISIWGSNTSYYRNDELIDFTEYTYSLDSDPYTYSQHQLEDVYEGTYKAFSQEEVDILNDYNVVRLPGDSSGEYEYNLATDVYTNIEQDAQLLSLIDPTTGGYLEGSEYMKQVIKTASSLFWAETETVDDFRYLSKDDVLFTLKTFREQGTTASGSSQDFYDNALYKVSDLYTYTRSGSTRSYIRANDAIYFGTFSQLTETTITADLAKDANISTGFTNTVITDDRDIDIVNSSITIRDVFSANIRNDAAVDIIEQLKESGKEYITYAELESLKQQSSGGIFGGILSGGNPIDVAKNLVSSTGILDAVDLDVAGIGVSFDSTKVDSMLTTTDILASKGMEDFFKDIVIENIEGAGQQLEDAYHNIDDNLKEGWDELEDLDDDLEELGQSIIDAVDMDTINTIGEAIVGTVEVIGDTVDFVGDVVVDGDSVDDAWQELKEDAQDSWDDVDEAWEGSDLGDVWKETKETVGTIGSALGESVGTIATDTAAGIPGANFAMWGANMVLGDGTSSFETLIGSIQLSNQYKVLEAKTKTAGQLMQGGFQRLDTESLDDSALAGSMSYNETQAGGSQYYYRNNSALVLKRSVTLENKEAQEANWVKEQNDHWSTSNKLRDFSEVDRVDAEALRKFVKGSKLASSINRYNTAYNEIVLESDVIVADMQSALDNMSEIASDLVSYLNETAQYAPTSSTAKDYIKAYNAEFDRLFGTNTSPLDEAAQVAITELGMATIQAIAVQVGVSPEATAGMLESVGISSEVAASTVETLGSGTTKVMTNLITGVGAMKTSEAFAAAMANSSEGRGLLADYYTKIERLEELKKELSEM